MGVNGPNRGDDAARRSAAELALPARAAPPTDRRHCQGDEQPSIKGSRPGWPNLKEALINTIRLRGAASIFGIIVGLAPGVLAGLRPGKLRDSVGGFPELMPWMVIITASVICFNLLADLAYAWLDPRIRLD